MPRRTCSFDASILRINDGAPVKVTFLNAEESGCLAGFYSIADGAFQDVRTLFANAGREALIPGVSSVFLGNRLSGKTPVFFVVKDGYTLNRDAPWFQEAAAGHNGFWRFLKPADRDDVYPAPDQGEIVWKKQDGSVAGKALPADLETALPVLVWQSNGGSVSVVKGRIFHSMGFVHAALNPDRRYRFLITPQNDETSVELDFIDLSAQRKDLSFNLQIGERNFGALTRNRVLSAAEMPVLNNPVLLSTVEIPDEFEDTLYAEGFEGRKTVSVAGANLTVEGEGTNRLIVSGAADVAVYEAFLSCVKIKTEASAAAKSDVSIVFKTEKEKFTVAGQVDILSEKVPLPAVPAGLNLSKAVVAPLAEKNAGAGVVTAVLPSFTAPAEQTDDLPSFLTQPVAAQSAVKTTSNGKTVLITGGAGKTGSVIAHAFAAAGYNVIVHCHTSVAQATRLVEELQQKHHVRAAYFRADFNSYEETADMIPAVTKTYGRIDVLVSRAFSPADGETPESWESTMAIDLRAPFVLIRSFALALPKGHAGSVVCVFPEPSRELSASSLISSALSGMVVQAAETYRDKIRVNGVTLNAGAADDSQKTNISETVCFLAQNPIFSGQILRIDANGTTGKKTSLF